MSRTPHFFKAYTRLGLTDKPIRQTQKNFGVEDAPNAILTPDFVKSLGNCKLIEFTFPNPEDINPKDYLSVLAVNLISFKDLINKSLNPGDTQIIIGGDNSVTFSSLLALIEKHGAKNIGYIQFDSHGDLNLLNSSPSKNFHGMYLRPFLDNFDIPQINDLVHEKLIPSQVIFIGDLTLDPEEQEFFAKNGLRNINRSEYMENKEAIKSKLNTFLKTYKHLHLNFDIDIFDQKYAGATGIPEDGRWGSEVFSLLKIISAHPSISLDLSEVNPKKDGAQKTIKLSQEIIKAIALP